MARLRNCVLALASNGVLLWDTTLSHAYEASAKYSLQELLSTDAAADVANATRMQINMEG